MNLPQSDLLIDRPNPILPMETTHSFNRRILIIFSALCAICAVGFSVASLSELQHSSSAPSFEPAVFACGQVAVGDKFAVVFVVRNKSASDLNVLRVSPDCGCMRLLSAPTVVKSNSSEQISLAFTASKRGQIDNVVLVDYLQLGDGIEQPQRVSLRVTADVQ